MPENRHNLADFYCKRFDFGVPLEDIVPADDIHPRLKQLFAETYDAFIDNDREIQHILRSCQGSLQDRLKLKERTVIDIHYRSGYGDFPPGAYFWVLRHFLGLLPVPLLPKYCHKKHFKWEILSKECKVYLENYEINRGEKDSRMDFHIAENICMLPLANVLLVNYFIRFIRALSTKCKQRYLVKREFLDRASLKCLIVYFYSSIFLRPFWPGHDVKNGDLFYLLFYMTLRWPKINKHCETIGHPARYSEPGFDIKQTKVPYSRDRCVQTPTYLPEIITIFKNKPYIFNDNRNYLKDSSCQTDVDLYFADNKKLSSKKTDSKSTIDKIASNYKLTFLQNDVSGIEEEPDDRSKNDEDPKQPQVFESTLRSQICHVSDCVTSNSDIESLYETALGDETFRNILARHNEVDEKSWDEVVKETASTVKKVEEYIYDDYETFAKEAFNQIFDKTSKRQSLVDKVIKFGWSYSPPNCSPKDENGDEKNGSNEILSESYIKFPTVDEPVQNKIVEKYSTFHYPDKEIEDQSLSVDHAVENKDSSGSEENETVNVTPEKIIDTNVFMQLNHENKNTPSSCNSEQTFIDENIQEDVTTRKKFNLKQFKSHFVFLRALTPRKSSTLSRVVSNVKYHRIKHRVRAHTL